MYIQKHLGYVEVQASIGSVGDCFRIQLIAIDKGVGIDELKAYLINIRERATKVKRPIKDIEKELLEAYREKRKWDGGEGRIWNASKHLDADDLIIKLEEEYDTNRN